MIVVKDFATKRTRMEGEPKSASPPEKARPLGRWMLLGGFVFMMLAYALWNHRQELEVWITSKIHGNPAILIVPPQAKSQTKPISPTLAPNSSAPAVQFDFYHVLSSHAGENSPAQETLLKTTQAPLPVVPTPPSPKTAEPSPAVTPMNPILEEPTPKPLKPIQAKPAKPAPVVVKAPVKTVPKTTKPNKVDNYIIEVLSSTDKNKAQALRAKLLMLGFEPKISAKNGRYFVHFSVMRNMSDVEKLRHQLEKSGINSSVVTFSGDAHGA